LDTAALTKHGLLSAECNPLDTLLLKVRLPERAADVEIRQRGLSVAAVTFP